MAGIKLVNKSNAGRKRNNKTNRDLKKAMTLEAPVSYEDLKLIREHPDCPLKLRADIDMFFIEHSIGKAHQSIGGEGGGPVTIDVKWQDRSNPS